MLDIMRDTGWFKSSYSSGDSDNCVEVRLTSGDVGIRDSKNVSAQLSVNGKAWQRFVAGLRSDESSLAV